MIVRVLLIGVLLLAAAAVQTAVLPLVTIGGFRPDLLLLVAVAFAVDDGPEVGVRVGFAAGLVTDLLVATSAIGVAALVGACVGYGIGTLRPYLAPNSATAPLLLCLVGSTLGTLAHGTLSIVLGDAVASIDLLVTAAIVVGVSHTLLVPLVLRLTRALSDRFPAQGTAATV